MDGQQLAQEEEASDEDQDRARRRGHRGRVGPVACAGDGRGRRHSPGSRAASAPCRRPRRAVHRDAGRALRDDDRHHDIDEEGQTAGQHDEHGPHDPHQRWIDVQLLGQPAGHARQHPVIGRSIETVSHIHPPGPSVNEPALASVCSSIFCGRAVETGSRPGRAVLDEAVVGIVVARHDALAGVQLQPDTRLGAQRTAPAFAWMMPVIDTCGRVTPTEPALSSMSIRWIASAAAEIDGRRAGIKLEPERLRRGRRTGRRRLPGVELEVDIRGHGLGDGDPPRVALAEDPERIPAVVPGTDTERSSSVASMSARCRRRPRPPRASQSRAQRRS